MEGKDTLSSEVQIFVSCSKLPSKDTFSKSDPMVVLYLKEGGTWKFQGRTEALKNMENPEFTQSFRIRYLFEENQELRFDVLDADSTQLDKLDKHDFIGYGEAVLGDLVAAPGSMVTMNLKRKNDKPVAQGATLKVRVEEIKQNTGLVDLEFACSKLKKMDGMFGKSDPYIKILRGREDGTWAPVHKTEVIKSNLNPSFPPFRIGLGTLCNGNISLPLRIQVWDWDKSSNDDLIGEFDATVKELMEQKQAGGQTNAVQYELRLLSAKSEKQRQEKRGEFTIKQCKVFYPATFLDYLKGGLHIGLMVAVDFTGSNGEPGDPRSLHYRNPSGAPNEYQQAIQMVGSILAPYDTDQKYPIWGFGGAINGETSHCFPLTFNPNQVEVQGVSGLLAAYNNAFNHVKLSGPTYFSELIQSAQAIASEPYRPGFQHYSILLILTDGIINDMQKTIDAVITASSVPLSIVIVGVGSADFSKMDALDSDQGALRQNGRASKRDIVQFVPMRKFLAQGAAAVAKHTLKEIPSQVLAHMKAVQAAPMPPRPAAPTIYQAAIPVATAPTPAAAPAAQMASLSLGAAPAGGSGPAGAGAAAFAGYGGQQ